MKHLVSFVLFLSFFQASHAQKSPVDLQARAREILSRMSLEEKIGQMTQLTLDAVLKEHADGSNYPAVIDVDKLNDALIVHHTGSVFNITSDKPVTIEQWNTIINTMQDYIMKHSRMKVPLLYGIDGMHGNNTDINATLFPHELGQAASWNIPLVKQAASVAAYQLRAAGINWNFSPVADLGVEPRWARFYETFGEDPLLAGRMAAAVAAGYQGESLYMGKNGVIACAKHFLGYSAPKSGKDRTLGLIPENFLMEYHVPPFSEAFNAGVKTVMINSSNINGLPVALNPTIINGLLKQKLGFDGFAVTDWQNVENIYNYDGLAESYKDAIGMAVNAGIDMFMVPWDYRTFQRLLTELVNEKRIPLSRIDDAVLRILKVKLMSGVFENPVTDYKKYKQLYSAQQKATAFRLAVESVTLLKNEQHILPLKKSCKILVTGPNSNSMRALNGGWTYSWSGFNADEYASSQNTILEAMRQEFGAEHVLYDESVIYKQKGEYYQDSVVSLTGIRDKAGAADVILVCLGENSYAETSGNLPGNLQLSDNQIALLRAAVETGKPVVLVLNEGRPRTLPADLLSQVRAVADSYLPGNYGGDALAAILSGRENPSGKLPFTYPAGPEYLAPYYHKVFQEVKGDQGQYYEGRDFYPAWQFGSGLSYTSFRYSDLGTDKPVYGASDTIRVSVRVKNNGEMAGKEAVLCFISDVKGNTLSPDVKRLRAFDKIDLAAGEEKVVTFSVAVKDLAFYNYDNEKILEEGSFAVIAGDQKSTFRIAETKIFRD